MAKVRLSKLLKNQELKMALFRKVRGKMMVEGEFWNPVENYWLIVLYDQTAKLGSSSSKTYLLAFLRGLNSGKSQLSNQNKS
jgi:hypothetical protein